MQTLSTSFIRKNTAFSLPEVALSMGIAATALLTLISLLPMGLDTLRSSNQKQAEARIIQAVMDRYQTGAWLEQNGSTGMTSVQLKDSTLFFAQTGTEVESAADVQCNYAVQVSIGRTPTLNGDSRGNDYLRELRVRITDRTQDYQNALASDSASGMYRERSVWIALMEQTGPLTSQPSYSSL